MQNIGDSDDPWTKSPFATFFDKCKVAYGRANEDAAASAAVEMSHSGMDLPTQSHFSQLCGPPSRFVEGIDVRAFDQLNSGINILITRIPQNIFYLCMYY
jgi:hypothetical protein